MPNKTSSNSIWWLISQEARVQLTLLQYSLYHTKPYMFDKKAEATPVRIDSETWEYENQKDIEKEMSRPPSRRLNKEGE